MTARFAVAILALASTARAESQVSIEKATVPWSDLQRLLSHEGASAVRPGPDAPRAYAVTSADIGGEIVGDRCRLNLQLEVEVLADRWTVVPLLPASLAVAGASVEGPGKNLLGRDAKGVALVVRGAGKYAVRLEVEGPLEVTASGLRLTFAPPGLTGGRASLTVRDGGEISGRTGWRSQIQGDGSVLAEAVLGASGLELDVPRSAAHLEASGSLEELDAQTELTLGGSGVTRLAIRATPGVARSVDLQLPHGARLWKVFVDGAPLDAASLGASEQIRIPLKRAARIELAYTFSAPPLGIRGRFHLELPHFAAPVRGAGWQLYLPEGLQYTETQSSLSLRSGCEPSHPPSRIAISSEGVCVALQRAVLDGAGYAEGGYAQPL